MPQQCYNWRTLFLLSPSKASLLNSIKYLISTKFGVLHKSEMAVSFGARVQVWVTAAEPGPRLHGCPALRALTATGNITPPPPLCFQPSAALVGCRESDTDHRPLG